MTIVTLTGPSCAGKSTLEAELIKHPWFKRIVSHTTRAPRAGEENGREYHFVEPDEFEDMRCNDEFAEVVEFGGNWYGATKRQFLDIIAQGLHPVVVCEPHGRSEILKFANQQGLPALPVFVSTDKGTIARRFVERFMVDFATSMSRAGQLAKVCNATTKRLEMILTEEAGWRPADHPNSVYLYSYGDLDLDVAVREVAAKATLIARDTVEG